MCTTADFCRFFFSFLFILCNLVTAIRNFVFFLSAGMSFGWYTMQMSYIITFTISAIELCYITTSWWLWPNKINYNVVFMSLFISPVLLKLLYIINSLSLFIFPATFLAIFHCVRLANVQSNLNHMKKVEQYLYFDECRWDDWWDFSISPLSIL